MIEVHQLTKDYGRHRALDAVSLHIAQGEVFGLLGPNGSGKSTTLRLLLGFLRPTAGWARVAGFDCWHQSVEVRKRVAYLPGDLRLYENMTGRQLVRFLEGLRQERLGHECDRLARRLDLELDRPIATLSSGMKRKLALLQVLLPRTPVLVLDEPTNTLDPTMRDALLDELRTARARGQTVLFSSHVLSEVEQICDRVGILSGGRLMAVRRMDELRQLFRVAVCLADDSTQPPPLPPGATIEKHEGRRWLIRWSGPLTPLLASLAQRTVTDLHVERIGLSALYHRYHAP
ncbi:MAG: ABC transporter ATP-binding protein [Gemmataceae bacterium]